MIAIIDLGLGNLFSVQQALKHLRIPSVITADPAVLRDASKLILPGVGNFFKASGRLHESGLVNVLREEVLERKKPILGICLGMQLMASFGEEGGGAPGLDFIPGKIRLLQTVEKQPRLPHVGWDDVTHPSSELFAKISPGSPFYFVHSYALFEAAQEWNPAICDYGIPFVAAFQKGPIAGVQFHPEKSQKNGLQMLENFAQGTFHAQETNHSRHSS